MAYTDLGKYTFTTAADYTGFNPGNLTSVLDPAAIRVPNYELYRLLINTSGVPSPATVPQVVQVAPFSRGTSLSALDITFPNATTKGNLVVVGYGGVVATGTDPQITGITLGGSADNWGDVVSVDETGAAAIWADPSTGEASDAIVLALNGSGTSPQTAGMAWEISGALATTTAGDSWDVASFDFTDDPGTAQGSAETPNILTTAANDISIGFGSAFNLANTPFTITQPQGYATQALPSAKVTAGVYGAYAGSYNPAGPAGASTVYAQAATTPVFWQLAAASFLATATPAANAPLPFSVAVDGVTWDSEQTIAGVGYTYAIGQSPLYLKTGQTLQIFWQLPAVSYLSYLPAFNITGWFRYDPSLQP